MGTSRGASRRHCAALLIFALGILFAGVLLSGRRWFENRLSESSRAARLLEDKVRNQESAARRAQYAAQRSQYVADIRQAPDTFVPIKRGMCTDVLSRHIPGPGQEDLRESPGITSGNDAKPRVELFEDIRVTCITWSFPRVGTCWPTPGRTATFTSGMRRTDGAVRTISASWTEVNASAFSPDGKTLATVDDEGKLKLWEIATGHCQFERNAHTGDAVIVRFTPDGKTIMTTGRTDGRVRTWDRYTGSMLNSIHANGFILSPDGGTLGLVGKQGEINLCDLSTRKPITSLPGTRGIQDAAFSHDGTKVVPAPRIR